MTIMPTKPWREIRAERSKLTREQRAKVDAEVRAGIARMRLPELRRARQLSQMTLADVLDMSQGDVSKLERRTDVYVRTLRRYVEALGGTLQIVARFADSEPIEIEGFASIASSDEPDEGSALRLSEPA
jgi:transcriptional regulator with XRE-family HTH domain